MPSGMPTRKASTVATVGAPATARATPAPMDTVSTPSSMSRTTTVTPSSAGSRGRACAQAWAGADALAEHRAAHGDREDAGQQQGRDQRHDDLQPGGGERARGEGDVLAGIGRRLDAEGHVAAVAQQQPGQRDGQHLGRTATTADRPSISAGWARMAEIAPSRISPTPSGRSGMMPGLGGGGGAHCGCCPQPGCPHAGCGGGCCGAQPGGTGSVGEVQPGWSVTRPCCQIAGVTAPWPMIRVTMTS